ncbi:hypothetical protein BN1723_006596 [Verticillium longisporum]|uniref:Alpha/beta hydrolase fold-3 domain-containing protein n=1 Tax=Verticillium longisporum TaxID=100787 RepID=A0A0G4NG36_VERLO|nr:hypothetical protein BN1723_006596 [Verticillium longisporum]
MLRKFTSSGGQSTSSASSSSSKRSRLSAKLSRSASRSTPGEGPCDEEYVNPLENVARWRLSAHALALRSGASFAFNWGNRSAPAPSSPSRTIYLDSTLSEWKGKDAIRVDVYEPSTTTQPSKARAAADPVKRVGVINLHGGGFILGSGTDDARWACAVVESLDAIVFSVNYRLAPGYPFPTPVEDTLDSILQIHARAGEFNVDPNRLLLSGFSAGGTLSLAAWRVGVINLHGGGFILGSGTDDARWACAVVESLDAVVFSVNYRLAPGYPFPTPVEDTLDSILQIHARAGEFNVDPNRLLLSGFSAGGTLSLAAWVILQDPSRWGYVLSSSPSIAGLALFYPLLDFTTSRPVKRRLCVKPHETLPKSMTDLFDASYIHPAIPYDNCDDPRLSPGLMPLEYMERLPPVHLCLCEMDMLLTEGLKFADNLREAGVTVTSRVVLGEKHAWDKPPPFAPKASVSVEYQAAIVAMRHWLSDDGAKLTRADVGTVNDQTRTNLGRINSIRSTPGTPRHMHSRGGGKGSKSSSTNSVDAGYAQVLSSQRWAHGFGKRSSSFDYGHRPQITTNNSQQAPWHVEFSNTFLSDDYDAAPTPTVPGGPRRFPVITSPTFPPVPPEPIEPQAPALERKRSARSAKSTATSRKTDSKSNTMTRESIPQNTPTPEPDSAPAPHIGYEKTKVPVHGAPAPTQPPSQTKERPGFFRRVFGSSKSNAASNNVEPPQASANDTENRPSSRPQNGASQAKSQSTPPSRDTSSSQSHQPVLHKKPSSFFRRRKKSNAEPPVPPVPAPSIEPPMPSAVPPPFLIPPSKEKLAVKPEPSPVSSLRRVMNPYLKGSPVTPNAPHPFQTIAQNAEASPEPEVVRPSTPEREPQGYKRSFSPDYEPSPNARIREVKSDLEKEPEPSANADEAISDNERRNDTPTRPPPEVPQPIGKRDDSFLNLDGSDDNEVEVATKYKTATHPLIGGISNIEYGWSDAIINNALVTAIHESTGGAPPSGRTSRPGSSATANPSNPPAARTSMQSSRSFRSASFDYPSGPYSSGSRGVKLPGDRIHISEWAPPTQSMRPSTQPEAEQLLTLLAYVKGVEDELQVHNSLRSPMLLAFTPRGHNAGRAMANWERKSSYLLREIVKFRTYVDCLQQADTRREEIYNERDTARRAALGDLSDEEVEVAADGDATLRA